MKKAFLVLALLFSISLYSQNENYDGSKLCLDYQGSMSFKEDTDADLALNKILSVIGASKRFVVLPCDGIDNALAVSYKGVRYILYDKEFMNAVSNETNSWSKLFILAHEVGHHINGHSLDLILYTTNSIDKIDTAARRNQELEADEFAGFVLGKLGATLEETSMTISVISTNRDDSYSTHPNKTKRLNAIAKGFNKANGAIQNSPKDITNTQEAERLYLEGKKLENCWSNNWYEDLPVCSKDENGITWTTYVTSTGLSLSIETRNKALWPPILKYYEQALEIDPNYIPALLEISNARSRVYSDARHTLVVSRYNGVISEEEESFEQNLLESLYKKSLQQNIIELTRAINLEPDNYDAYMQRSQYYGDLNYQDLSFKDYKKGIEIGYKVYSRDGTADFLAYTERNRENSSEIGNYQMALYYSNVYLKTIELFQYNYYNNPKYIKQKLLIDEGKKLNAKSYEELANTSPWGKYIPIFEGLKSSHMWERPYILFKNNKYKETIEACQEAFYYIGDGANSTYYNLLGLAYLRLGNTYQACSAWSKGIEKYKANPNSRVWGEGYNYIIKNQKKFCN